MARYRDRHDAGRRLAEALAGRDLHRPVVLALPRGGVPVGAEVAAALHAPLEVVVARKLGAPGHPELGIGAIVEGLDAPVVTDVADRLGVGDDRLRITALLSLPLVVLVSKVHGLYDRDSLLIHKTTIDEAGQLFQLATLYTLVFSPFLSSLRRIPF